MTITKKMREQLYNEMNGRCAYCGQKIDLSEMQVDHIIPRYRGGSNNLENLICSCRSCNHYKRAANLPEFRRKIFTMIDRLKKDYVFKIAVRYGMITINKVDDNFYFERLNNDLQV